jgi:hypothetical protein
MSLIPKTLIQAYRGTDFVANLPDGECVLRVGIRNTAMVQYLKDHESSNASYITACNPFSRIFDQADNQRATIQLESVISAMGLTSYPCDGRDPTGQWPDEPGFLVLGVKRSKLRSIGRRFRQNAIIIVGRSGIPKLELLR